MPTEYKTERMLQSDISDVIHQLQVVLQKLSQVRNEIKKAQQTALGSRDATDPTDNDPLAMNTALTSYGTEIAGLMEEAVYQLGLAAGFSGADVAAFTGSADVKLAPLIATKLTSDCDQILFKQSYTSEGDAVDGKLKVRSADTAVTYTKPVTSLLAGNDRFLLEECDMTDSNGIGQQGNIYTVADGTTTYFGDTPDQPNTSTDEITTYEDGIKLSITPAGNTREANNCVIRKIYDAT